MLLIYLSAAAHDCWHPSPSTAQLHGVPAFALHTNCMLSITHHASLRLRMQVLETVEACIDEAGLPHDVADALARQRCEQTHLLSAMAWALRQASSQ